MIHLLTSCATAQQLPEMLEELEDYVKLAVDIEQGTAAGGGELHADCEAVLLANGSQQENVWGADTTISQSNPLPRIFAATSRAG